MGYHEALGVSQNASKGEIKKAFRDKAKEFHPDLSNSPEAAEAFKRIKEAHDALMKEAEVPRESVSATSASAHAAAATAQMAYAQPDPEPEMTEEELKHIQHLDEQANKILNKQGFFRRGKISEEIRRHAKKIKTNNQRLSGKY